MPYFLIGVVALAILLLMSKTLVNADVRKLANALRTFGGIIAFIFGVAFLLTGRAPIGIPLAGLGVMLLGRAFSIPGFGGGAGQKAPGQSSEVRTDYLHMTLDHDSGALNGNVLKGRWKGKRLDDLSKDNLLDLMHECAAKDTQSQQIIAAYLDQVHPNWREDAGASGAGDNQRTTGHGAAMTIDEAYDILGLRPGATASDIQAAHRKLMKHFHPDHGGSNYLASKINDAKDMLLKSI